MPYKAEVYKQVERRKKSYKHTRSYKNYRREENPNPNLVKELGLESQPHLRSEYKTIEVIQSSSEEHNKEIVQIDFSAPSRQFQFQTMVRVSLHKNQLTVMSPSAKGVRRYPEFPQCHKRAFVHQWLHKLD